MITTNKIANTYTFESVVRNKNLFAEVKNMFELEKVQFEKRHPNSVL